MSLHQAVLHKFSSRNYCASIFFGSLEHSTSGGREEREGQRSIKNNYPMLDLPRGKYKLSRHSRRGSFARRQKLRLAGVHGKRGSSYSANILANMWIHVIRSSERNAWRLCAYVIARSYRCKNLFESYWMCYTKFYFFHSYRNVLLCCGQNILILILNNKKTLFQWF